MRRRSLPIGAILRDEFTPVIALITLLAYHEAYETRQAALIFTAVLAALGYIGAGLFYGYLLGFDTQTPLSCPVCPHILSLGDPLHKFLARTLVLGTLNALLLASVGWCLLGLVIVAKSVIRYWQDFTGNQTNQALTELCFCFEENRVYSLRMEPTPLKRVFFWATYTLGTLALVFGLLLAQVPRPRDDKVFRLEFAIWGSCFLFLAICLLLLREIFSARCREVDGEPERVYSVFSVLGVAQLCFSLFALVSIFVEVISH